MDLYHLQENIKNNYWKQDQMLSKLLLKKAVHKTGEFLGNKIADSVAKSNDDIIVKTKPVEEIITPPQKKEEI